MSELSKTAWDNLLDILSSAPFQAAPPLGKTPTLQTSAKENAFVSVNAARALRDAPIAAVWALTTNDGAL